MGGSELAPAHFFVARGLRGRLAGCGLVDDQRQVNRQDFGDGEIVGRRGRGGDGDDVGLRLGSRRDCGSCGDGGGTAATSDGEVEER